MRIDRMYGESHPLSDFLIGISLASHRGDCTLPGRQYADGGFEQLRTMVSFGVGIQIVVVGRLLLHDPVIVSQCAVRIADLIEHRMSGHGEKIAAQRLRDDECPADGPQFDEHLLNDIFRILPVFQPFYGKGVKFRMVSAIDSCKSDTVVAAQPFDQFAVVWRQLRQRMSLFCHLRSDYRYKGKTYSVKSSFFNRFVTACSP